MLFASSVIEFFARGGGGGSGGGSSGGGGGGILAFLFMAGYVPTQWGGSKFRSSNKMALGSFIQWPLAVIALVVFSVVLKGYGFLIGIGALVGTGSGLYGWAAKAVKQASSKTSNQIETAAALDPAWDETSLLETTSKIFMKYQEDWMNYNVGSVKSYTSDYYYQYTSLMLQALKLAGRKNVMANVEILSQTISSMNDSDQNDMDWVSIEFSARAIDSLVEVSTDTVLYTDKSSFTEYWTFIRRDGVWKLDNIDQATADLSLASEPLKMLASNNNYFYSIDWGCLLLPKRGQLFANGKFGVSDINNHIIGNYDDALIQLYTYQPNPNADSSGMRYYLIAQANVQKNYGDIVVRRKKFLQGNVGGLQKIETEWTTFNKKYEVFASSTEGATSFELLEPSFMEKLNALSFEVNIEVVDNIVYLYSLENKLDPDHYPEMLSILHEAYGYMKR
jgi:hypothetical protein